MQCYTELLPPTAVTHAVALPFLAPNANNLVVAKTSLLQVFEVKEIRKDGGREAIAGHEAGEDVRQKLVLVGEYPLSGTVIALEAVGASNRKSTGDSVLIAFKDAKLSLISWDRENHRIGTVSIHYYEGQSAIGQTLEPTIKDFRSLLSVDPESRCAAFVFGQRQLAILPFRQSGDELAEIEDTEMNGTTSATTGNTHQLALDGAGDVAAQTPYKASFVVHLTTIEDSLTHPIDLAFLYEYREATFGTLHCPSYASRGLIEDRRDVLTYSVFTLDLDQRASTSLATVSNLPPDLWKVVPLPLPIGGAVLVGINELVHVDQAGKTNAVAVNEFATVASDFSMTDQSSLNIQLEDSEFEFLDPKTGDILIALRDGSLAVLTFQMSGRNVSELSLTHVGHQQGGSILRSTPSCIASVEGGVFIGSDDGDSLLLSCTKQGQTTSKKRSHAQMVGDDAKDDDEEEDELYTSNAGNAKRGPTSSAAPNEGAAAYSFLEEDRVLSLGPIHELSIGKSPQGGRDSLEAVAACGRGQASRLVYLNSEIVPDLDRQSSIDGANDVWSIYAKPKDAEESADLETANHDNFMFVFTGQDTMTYDIPHAATQGDEQVQYEERTGTEFEHEGQTVDVGTLANNTRIIQCRQTEVRTYDSDLGLSQIIPMLDDTTDAELKIVHTSFGDPYLLLLLENSSVQILHADQNGEVEPLDADVPALSGHKWITGCLYSGPLTNGEHTAFLLREDGGLCAFSLPDLKPVFTAQNLSHLSPVVIGDAPHRRTGFKETLTDLLVADIGPSDTTKPYLILRSASDELTIYEPFNYPDGEHATSWAASLRFRKVPNGYLPKYDESADGGEPVSSPLRPAILNGSHTVILPGSIPALVTNDNHSLPKIIRLGLSRVQKIVPLNRPGEQRGLASLSTGGTIREYSIAPDSWFGTGWSANRITVGSTTEEVRNVAYHEERGVYIVATCRPVAFHIAEVDERYPEEAISLPPTIPQYTLHILSASSRRLIISHELPANETVTSIKVMTLEVSEHTHEQKAVLVVGAGVQRGEDTTNFPARGVLTVFDFIDVVPDPEIPESGIKLHSLAREETKGVITAVEQFPGGLIGTTQGQKMLVRGLKEDGSCLPVAFLDAQCQMTTLKSLGETGMWLVADIWKGLWFGGFTEEPYKLTLLGKSRSQLEVPVAEFLPFDGQLYLLLVDADMDLHVLHFDPENPKSLSGTRLIHRSKFHIGHFPTSMKLLPSTLAPFASQTFTNGNAQANGDDHDEDLPPQKLFHILITTTSGAVGLITPVDETTYRRLGSLQAHLTNILEHPAGLNPREYRAIESEGFGAGARGVLDGDLVKRIGELGAARRAEVLGRSGSDAWALRSDLEILSGGGLGYL